MEKKAFFQQLDERTDIRYTDSGMKIIRLKFPRAHLRLCNVKSILEAGMSAYRQNQATRFSRMAQRIF